MNSNNKKKLNLKKPVRGIEGIEEERSEGEKKTRQIKIKPFFGIEEAIIVLVYIACITYFIFLYIGLRLCLNIDPFDVNKVIEYFSLLMFALIGAPLLKDIAKSLSMKKEE